MTCPHCGGEHFGQRFDDCPFIKRPEPLEIDPWQMAEINRRLATEHGVDLATLPPVPEIGCCEHGTAMDVHCCNCHSGFIFERDHVCPEVGQA